MEELETDIAPKGAKARVQVGYGRLDEVAGKSAKDPFRGEARRLLRSLFRRPGSDHLVEAFELGNEEGNLVVRVRHVDVGPHHDAPSRSERPSLAGGARPMVLGEADDADVLVREDELVGAVRRAVVDDDDLVGVRRAIEAIPDALDLPQDVPALVVHGQHD
jgi:hypothetical protein